MSTNPNIPEVNPEAKPEVREEKDGASKSYTNFVTDLLKELRDEMQVLVHKELLLFRTEMVEKAEAAQNNIKYMVIGGTFLLVAFLFVLWALNFGLTSLYVEVGIHADVSVWLAPLTLAVIIGITGWAILKRGKSSLENMSVTPEKTIDSLKNTGEWAKRKAK